MIVLNLCLNSDMYINELNQVCYKLSPNTNTKPNAFLFKNGLWIDKDLVSTQRGLIDQTGYMVRVGYASGYATSMTKQGRVSVNNPIHRIFTSVDDKIINFRSSVDTIKPGDIVRVPRSADLGSSTACEYFLITKTTETSLDNDNGRVGNAISEKVSLGNFSWCGSDEGYEEYVAYLNKKSDGGETS